MLKISNTVSIPLTEISFHAIRAQGPGGQNVNKVSSAVHLRFDIASSSLPNVYKEKLLKRRDHRITKDGLIIIKAQQYRSQEQNREDALFRLQELIKSATFKPKKRLSTKPTRASREKRIAGKIKRGRLKVSRGKVAYE